MSKRIAHLTSVHPSKDVRVYEKELNSLKDAGYECFLVCLNQTSEITPTGVHIVSVQISSKKRVLRATLGALKVVLRGLRLNAKSYHIHDPELLPWAILLKIFNKKIIYDVHENYAASLMTKPYLRNSKIKRKLISWTTGKLERFFSSFYDLIIATTPLIANLFDPKKTIVIENYPIIYFPTEDTSSKRSKNLIYAGGLTRIRGVKEMVQVMGLIPEHHQCRLVLAGKFESAAYEAEIKSLPEWSKVIYVGWQSRDQLNQLCLQAYLGLLLFHKVQNHYFCVPNKIFEYLSCGLPVVATNFEHWSDFSKGTDCIRFVDPYNVSEIAKQVIAYLEEPNIEKTRRNATSVVKQYFTWDSEKKKLIDAYAKLV